MFKNNPSGCKKCQIASSLGKSHFKGTNRKSLKHKYVGDESGNVNDITSDVLGKKLPKLLEGYDEEDIFNLRTSS